MSDKKKANSKNSKSATPSPKDAAPSVATEGKPPVEGKQILVNAQYVKDLSFENPKAPKNLIGQQARPKIDVNVDVKASKLDEHLYEVTLKISANAKREAEIVFITELTYAGIFTVKGIAENEQQMALLVICPSILFPFARRIISDATRDGGFPPLMLDPIDFSRLQAKREAQVSEKKIQAN